MSFALTRQLQLLARIRRLLLHAHRTSGRSLISLALEALSHRLGPVRLGLTEYFEYKAYARRDRAVKPRAPFLGFRMCVHADRVLNSEVWRSTANDKLVTYSMLRAAAIPFPELLAVYSPEGRSFAGARALRHIDDVRAFLASGADYPLFMKPVHGTYGRGAYGLESFEADRGVLRLLDGNEMGMQQLESELSFAPYKGMLFQQLIRQHPVIVDAVGPRVCTVRFRIIRARNGFKTLCAQWKIAAGSSMIDNFHGAANNLLGGLELATGTVTHVMQRRDGLIAEVERHPDTGTRLVGLVIPHWREAEALCHAAAPLFDGLWLQHWDVAICAEGPLALEVNTESDFSTSQLATRHGLLTEDLRAALAERRAYDVRLRAAARGRSTAH